MSDVEKYYERIRLHWPNARPWEKLMQHEQQNLCTTINVLIGILNR